jgi:hypothetical protein
MLTDLNEQQSSDEQVWVTKLSFDVETRDTEQGETVHRTYTYTYGEEFDEWHLYHYQEKRCDESTPVGKRDWRIERDVFWDSAEAADIDIPSEVSRKLSVMLENDVRLR